MKTPTPLSLRRMPCLSLPPPRLVRICLVSALIFSVFATARAQCSYQASTSDATCTSNHDCLEQTGCASLAFTPTCTGWYNLEAWIDCGDGDCGEFLFQSCVNVYDGDTRIGVNCHNSPCNDCHEDCVGSSGGAVCLQADHEYKLNVCLTACLGGTCPSPPSCTAYGKVKFNGNGTCSGN